MSHGIIPPIEYLTDTPVTMSAGACLVHDQRGTCEGFGRYIYAIFALDQFWRYDIWTDSWQQMTSPNVVAGTAFGAGVAMCLDPSKEMLYLFLPGAGAVGFQSYNPYTDDWTTLSVVGLPAGWATSGNLLHRCSSLVKTRSGDAALTYLSVGTTLTDDDIYLVGNGAVATYVYTISTNTWALIVPLNVRPGAPGAGSTLDWMPNSMIGTPLAGWGIDILYSVRGNGSAGIDLFTIPGPLSPGYTWDNAGGAPFGAHYMPPLYTTAPETFATGTCSAWDPISGDIVIYRNTTMSLRAVQYKYQSFLTAGTAIGSELVKPVGSFPGIDGVAHPGQALVFSRNPDGTAWFYFAKHSGNTFIRLQRTE